MTINPLLSLIHNEQQRVAHATYLSEDFLKKSCEEVQKRYTEICKQNISLSPASSIEDIANDIASEASIKACNELIEKINCLFSDPKECQGTVKKQQMYCLFELAEKIKNAIVGKYHSS